MHDSNRIGDYELIAVLGRGSFGTVWEARHVTLNRLSAVKVLHQHSATERNSERFVREAQIAAELRHPNIVRIQEVGRSKSDDVDYLVYELIEGVTLTEWSQFSELNHREIAELFVKLASALHNAHENGIVHRDLKPENILVDLQGEPHIADFGLARKLSDRLTEQNVTLGTVAYMSPEQARGDSSEADGRADIFSLGALLFEVLTGELPFQGRSIPSYIARISEGAMKSPQKLAQNVPQDLATICLKCLSHQTTDRYQTAIELQNDLSRFVDGRPILARRTSVVERFRRWCIRQPIAAALLLLLVLLAIGGPAVAIRQSHLRGKINEQARSLMKTNHALRSSKYNTDLYLAYQAWNDRRIEQAHKILNRAIPDNADEDMRDFAWHLLNDRAEATFQIVARSEQPINRFVLTNDERFLVVSDQSDRLAIWDLYQRKRVRSIPMIQSCHHAVAMLGDQILVGDRIGDMLTGRPVLCVYDFESGDRTATVSFDAQSTIETIAVSPTQELISLGVRYDGIYLFDREFKFDEYIPHAGRHHSLAFSPDGQYLLTELHQTGNPKSSSDAATLIRVADRKVVQQQSQDAQLFSLAWHPDSAVVAVHDSFGRGKVLRVPNMKTVGDLKTHPLRLRTLEFMRDGRTLVGGADNGTIFTQHVNLRGMAYGTVKYLPHTSRVSQVHSRSDGTIISASKDGTVVLSRPNFVSTDGATMIGRVGAEAKMVYGRMTGRGFCGDKDGSLRDLNGEELTRFASRIKSLALSLDEERLACGLANGEIFVLSTTDQRLLCVFESQPDESPLGTNELKFYERGKRLISVHQDGSLRFWNARDEHVIASHASVDSTTKIAISKNTGLALANVATELIRAYRLTDGAPVFELATDGVTSLLTHPTLPLLFSGHSDHSVRVWNIESRKLEWTFRGHDGAVLSLTLHDDGKTLASGCEYGTIRLWDVERMAEIGVAYSALDRAVRSVEFSRVGGQLLALLSTDGPNNNVVRVGKPFVNSQFTGYTVLPEQINSENVESEIVRHNGERCLEIKANSKRRPNHIVSCWLDERCKGKEVRATFHVDMLDGNATAYIDHFYGNDRHSVDTPSWHVASRTVDRKATDQQLQTGWLRITHGIWTGRADEQARPYAALLVVGPNSHVRIRSIEIECRDPSSPIAE